MKARLNMLMLACQSWKGCCTLAHTDGNGTASLPSYFQPRSQSQAQSLHPDAANASYVLHHSIGMQGRGLNVSMVGCVVSGTCSTCLTVEDKARVSLGQCELNQSQQDCAVSVSHDGSMLVMKRCLTAYSIVCGTLCAAGAVLRAERTHIPARISGQGLL